MSVCSLGLLGSGCTTTYSPASAALSPVSPAGDPAALQHEPLDLSLAQVSPEPITVGSNIALRLYTFFHRKGYGSFRVDYPGSTGEPVIGHFLLPPGEGRHPLVIVFPILEGSHVVSEGLAKALVNRGYAVARIERRALPLETSSDPTLVAEALRGAVLDARRLLDWAASHPQVDSGRIAAAGVSLGSIQALLLTAVDPRIRGGFYVLTGGSLAEILYDSTEVPVRVFRDRLIEKLDMVDRESFVATIRPLAVDVEPLGYAGMLDRDKLLMASGRFDRVIHPARAEQLWKALGQPTWIRIPSGHYQFFPYFWWVTNRGADHLDRLFSAEE
ncbi:MAG: hypothetical protein GY725_23240 [bacterium]|nr:hypothetical protein [bacterium]